MKLIKLAILLVPALLLAACGGGSSTSSSSPAMSVFITDNLSLDYSKVWVTVTQVTANGPNGPVTLYDNPQGGVYNLTELHGVGALLDTQALDPGTYTDFQVTLTNDVTLVDKTGQSIAAHFNATGDPIIIDVVGSVTVGSANTAVAFDFDLKQFSYDPATGLVTPVVLLVHQDGVRSFDRCYGEIQGYVDNIVDAQTFDLRLHNGTIIAVTLQATATVINRSAHQVRQDTSGLVVGQHVEVYGNYDSVNLTLAAVRIKIEGRSGLNQVARDRVEGVVQSFDGTTLVLDVREASFVPSGTTLDIDVANVLFTKGSLSDLSAGQWVELHGTWLDPVYTATIIEIEGGLPQWTGHANGHSYSHDYAEVKGTVDAVNGNIVTVTITRTEHFAWSFATIDVDVTGAWYKYGDNTCLQPGAFIEAKGAVDSNGMSAAVVEIESACGTTTGGGSGYSSADVKGTVAAVNGDLVTLNVVRAEYFNPGGTQIDVDVSGAWYEHGSAAQLATGVYLEVNGSWDGTTFTAARVEFK